MSYELQATSCEIPNTNYELKEARYKIVPASADLSLHRTLRETTGYQNNNFSFCPRTTTVVVPPCAIRVVD